MSIVDLLTQNREWAAQVKAQQPDLFFTLAKKQQPDYLWIGCADSRVPATQVVGLSPGQLFVHRNVANLIKATDTNAQSVIEYGVTVLKVKHIIVCGHYGCGGVQAAMADTVTGLDHVDTWLAEVRSVHDAQQSELQDLPDDQAKFDRMCEFNVEQQVYNLAQTTSVQHAWRSGQALHIHGLIYSMRTGLLHDLGISRSA